MKIVVVALLCCCLPLVLSANPQAGISSGEIRGRLVDPSGAAIPNGSVVVTNRSTGKMTTIQTAMTGDYRALLLPPDLYDVRAEANGFNPQVQSGVPIAIGQTLVLDFALAVGRQATPTIVEVTQSVSLAESDRSQQSNTISAEIIQSLPIDRRDWLTHTQLVPGVADSEALADASDYRLTQAAHSGLSFYGNNGRGNSVTIDGGEANDSGGGVRPTLSQDAVREFQINRSNYSVELGGATGGIVNIVSKSGTNSFHGSAFALFRHDKLDAGDPFATQFLNGTVSRIKPPSDRQQFGGAFGGPISENRTFFFSAFEGLDRDESNSVSVLTDNSIFGPTPQQEAILATLPSAAAAGLRAALTSPQSTRDLFISNSGVFPYQSTDYKFSTRLDHRLTDFDQFMFRYNMAEIDESNPNTKALIGASKAITTERRDQTGILNWTRTLGSRAVNQVHYQFNYGSFFVNTAEKFGPELNINGFGIFNRDLFLPSSHIWRRHEMAERLTMSLGRHLLKLGGEVMFRGNVIEAQAFFPGRFTFGSLPGSLVNPALASTTLTALQGFNLGLALAYQQGFGDPRVASTDPFTSVYVEDRWQITRNLTIDLGVRYELDDMRDPVPTDKNNIAPRVGFAWDPTGSHRMTVRGGYGIFYAPTNYALAHVVNALGEMNGYRQIAQVLTTIQTPGAASAANIYQTLLRQGVITLPTPNRTISRSDLTQFGITVANDGPRPPLTVLFSNSPDAASSYSQQASLGIERQLGSDWLVSANYLFVRGLKILRARDRNLLPAPINPATGVRTWSTGFFKDPLLFQDNVYESTGNSFYHGMTLELQKRFSRNVGLNVNYTLSKAIDEVVDFNSDFQASDQLNLPGERSLSSFDQRHKFVVFASLESPFQSAVLNNTTLSPIVRASSGRPFNLLVGSDLNGDRHSTTDRPAFAGRNTGLGPNFWTVDLRLTRRVQLSENSRAEFTAEAFNLFNRLNFRSVNNTVGNIAGPFNLKGRSDVGPSQPLGFTSAFDPRRIQLGARITF